jgi:hypothetical protein
MFQSIEYKRPLGYNVATKQYEDEYEFVDSDFGKVVAVFASGAGEVAGADAGAVIQEYGKRNLNVAANLVRCFKFQEKEYDWSIAEQIARAEKYQPAFTPELKAALDKYLILL